MHIRSHAHFSFVSVLPHPSHFTPSLPPLPPPAPLSMTLLLKGTPVIFVSVHLTCNTGIAGTNLQKLSERSAHTSPTLVSPLSLQGIGMFCLPSCLNRAARIKGEILLPCDLELSCTSRRLIDYAVCHRSLVNVAVLQSFVEGPWKTLQALLLTLPRSPRRFFTRSLTTSPMKCPPTDRNSVFSSWSECVNLSESFHFRPPERSLPGYLDPDPVLSQKLALEYSGMVSCFREIPVVEM